MKTMPGESFCNLSRWQPDAVIASGKSKCVRTLIHKTNAANSGDIHVLEALVSSRTAHLEFVKDAYVHNLVLELNGKSFVRAGLVGLRRR